MGITFKAIFQIIFYLKLQILIKKSVYNIAHQNLITINFHSFFPTLGHRLAKRNLVPLFVKSQKQELRNKFRL